MDKIYQDVIQIKSKSKNKLGTILFIHGFTSSNMLHFYFQENFNANLGYDYLAINLPGHQFHNNSNNIKDYDFQKYIDYVYKYIINENLDNLILIGHSMGGGIAMFLSEKIKERIKKIILVSAINSSIFKSKVGISFLNSVNNNNSKGIKKLEFFKYHNELNNNDEYSTMNEYIKFEIHRFFNNKKRYMYLGAQLLDPILYFKLDKIYKKNKIPTLFLIGKYDKVIPYNSTIKYLRQLKNSHLTIKTIDNASHVSFIDNFKEYDEYLWWFINR